MKLPRSNITAMPQLTWLNYKPRPFFIAMPNRGWWWVAEYDTAGEPETVEGPFDTEAEACAAARERNALIS